MRNTFIMLLLLLSAPWAWAGKPLKLMTYNVKNANGMDGVCNYQRIADALNRAQPDVVAMQELDSMTHRSGQKDVLHEIARLTGMKHYFAPAIPYDGGKYGIGILAKETPIRLHTYPLPGREEARTLLLAEFNDYIFCCTHLSLTREDRMQSLQFIGQIAAGTAKPFFLAGDFNDEPESEFIQTMKKQFQLLSNAKQPTFPAPQPQVTLDYIAALKQENPTFVAHSSQVLNEPVASDHRPLVVELTTAEDADQIFRTKPYLQNPVGNGITVMWQTNVPANCWVEYGTDTLQLQQARTLVDGQAVCNNTLHKIRLEPLKPGEKYYYRICSQEILLYQAYRKVFGHTARSPFSEFKLPAAGNEDFTAVVFNDLHKQSKTFRALCAQVKGLEYDFAVFNGDCVDDPANHDEATAFIGELAEGVEANRRPAFFMRGNHEIRNAYSIGLRALYDYVGDKTYGAFNWGDTRIVMLDCGEDKEDSHWVYYGLNDFSRLRNDQVEFLKTELASKAFRKAARRVLIHHIPLYGNDGRNLCTALWDGLLKKAPFDISVNAHTHRYAYHPKGTVGNNFPVVIGGGYGMDNATVMVIEKKGKSMQVKVINTRGEVLLHWKADR